MGEDKKTKDATAAGENKSATGVKKVYVNAQPVSTLVAVIVTIIAMAGLAIGVYGLMNFRALNEKMAESHSTSKAIGEVDCGDNEDGDKNKCENEVAGADENTIYVGAWGIAISIPEDTFSRIAYNYYEFENGGDAVYVSAVIKDASVSNPAYFEQGGNSDGLAAIGRMKTDEYEKNGDQGSTKIIELDGYTYYYSHPQDVTSTKAADVKVETDSTEVLKKVLTNAENFSKF